MKYSFIDRGKETKDRGSFDNYFKNQYAPSLLKGSYISVQHTDTREARIELDPLANALVCRVADLLVMNPPIFLDSNENEIESIKIDWIAEDYDSIFRECIISTRTHGFCVTEKLTEAFAGKNYLVHNLANGIMKVNLDDRWNIKSYNIRPKLESDAERLSSYAVPTRRELLAKNSLHYSIGRKGKYSQQGLNILKPIWAQLVHANEILEAMCLFFVRVGNGWLIAKVDPSLYQGDETALSNMLKNMNSRKFGVLKQTKESPADIEFIGSSVQVDFSKGLETVIGIISAKTGFCTRWFMGAPKGFISAAKEDRYQVYATLKSIFADYKDWIRAFIEKFYDKGPDIIKKIAEIEFDDEGVLEEIGKDMENGVIGKSEDKTKQMQKQIKYLATKKQLED